MLLFIEEYPYELDLQVRGKLIRDILGDVVKIPKKEKTYTPEYVGYCYSREAKDAIFFLRLKKLNPNITYKILIQSYQTNLRKQPN